MKAIEILKAVCVSCLESDRSGIVPGFHVHKVGFYSYFGIILKGSFPLDDEKQYFYYYGKRNETLIGFPIEEALVFNRGKIDALYLWPIDED